MWNEMMKETPMSPSKDIKITNISIISGLYDEAVKLGEKEEKFYTALDCVGHRCFFTRTSTGFFALASGYGPPYEIYEKPLKVSGESIEEIFTDHISHGYHCLKEITKEEYEEKTKTS